MVNVKVILSSIVLSIYLWGVIVGLTKEKYVGLYAMLSLSGLNMLIFVIGVWIANSYL